MVESNAVTLLVKLLSIPIEEVLAADLKNGKRPKLEKSKSVLLPAVQGPSTINLQFFTLRRRHYVDSGNDRGLRIGMKYLRSIDIAPEEATGATPIHFDTLCGVRMVRGRLGAIAVQIKNGSSWTQGWQQDPNLELQDGQMAISTTQVEWAQGFQPGSFVVISDVS